MRLFLGVGLSDELRRPIAALCADWRGRGPDLKWVSPELLHLTLRFIGDLPPERVATLIRTVERVECTVFTLTFGDPITLPPGARGRVLALEPARGAAPLGSLAGEVERTLVGIGIPLSARPFRGHLTLARARRGGTIPVTLRPEGLTVPRLPELRVGEFTLYESELTPQGPRYRALHRFQLSG